MASHDEDEIGTLSSSSSSSSCSDLNRPSSSALDSDAGREKSSRLVEDSTEGGNDVDSIFDSIAKSEGPKELETCPGELQIREEVGDEACENHYGLCAICLNKIVLQETALIKGCEHAYCVTCILRWATYKEKTTCPQCKHPFESLSVHRSLDGSIRDYMDEESVCLLLRASWFIPLIVEQPEEAYEDEFDYYMYENQYDEDDEDDLNEMYLTSSPNLRIGNRRWGDNGYVRAGRQEARPAVSRQVDSVGPSRRKKEKAKEKEKEKENNIVKENSVGVGRRAKRALKREAADKAAAAKHEQHLLRFGRN